jgi:non-homologous end joining protein Ku
MARPLWKGHVSFGMVSIPVGLLPADRPEEISFELLDDRDLAPIGYRKVNKTSGDEVPREHIARGFRLEDGQVVIVDDEDLKKASPERSQTLEIHAFINENEVPPIYFERPYYLVPSKGGEKGYALLRDAMKGSKKAAIGSVVLRARQHLTLLFPEGEWLVLNTLRSCGCRRNRRCRRRRRSIWGSARRNSRWLSGSWMKWLNHGSPKSTTISTGKSCWARSGKRPNRAAPCPRRSLASPPSAGR